MLCRLPLGTGSCHERAHGRGVEHSPVQAQLLGSPRDVGATTYYVKPDGSDCNNGTSWDTALKTPNKGFDKIHNKSESHEVVIAAGMYLIVR